MSLLDTLDPILIPWAQQLLDLAERAGVHPQVTSARRSYSEQAALYKRFKEGRSRFPAAAPGTSAHEWGLAFDLVVPNPTDQQDLGVVWHNWGGVYGGSYDPVHFEYPGFRAPTAETAPAAQEPPTFQRIEDRVYALADLMVALVPSPLRGILGIAELATLISTIAGNPAGPGLEWMLSHPAEVTEAFLKFGWGNLIALI